MRLEATSSALALRATVRVEATATSTAATDGGEMRSPLAGVISNCVWQRVPRKKTYKLLPTTRKLLHIQERAVHQVGDLRSTVTATRGHARGTSPHHTPHVHVTYNSLPKLVTPQGHTRISWSGRPHGSAPHPTTCRS